MTPEQIAETIMLKHVGKAIAPLAQDALRKAIADAVREAEVRGSLRAAVGIAPPPGHVLDDKGVVRKVLGELILTGDGCVVTPTSFVWVMPPHCANPGGFGFTVIEVDARGPFADAQTGGLLKHPAWSDCYSTREAALAARSKT